MRTDKNHSTSKKKKVNNIKLFVKIAHGFLLHPAIFHCLKEENQIKVLEQDHSSLQLTGHHSARLASLLSFILLLAASFPSYHKYSTLTSTW